MSNTNEDKSIPEEPKKRGRGRPRKTDILSKKEGGRKTMGRPKGDATIINEYKARMLASPKSRKVLDTIFEAALDNEHKNQSAAWKLVMDRIAPVAAFEKDIIKNGGGNAISINITGVGSGGVKVGNDVVDGEYKELDNE
jgi:hypothetical protein